MQNVTLLTTNETDRGQADDLLLKEELLRRGYCVQIKPWETLQDEGEDLFIIRSTWNYTDRYDDFLKCIQSLDNRLWNPLPLVKWNSNKKYLIELFDKNFQVIPLQLARDSKSLENAIDDLGGNEFIVKPLVGAGSRG
ncbi:MAG: hypothetical protein R2827_12930 [Bdellovibrionales bacterium]